MHVSPLSGDTYTKFKSTSVRLKPTTLGNIYIIVSVLSLTFLHSYQFLIFLTLLPYHHSNHFYENANTDTYTYRVACNLPYQ